MPVGVLVRVGVPVEVWEEVDEKVGVAVLEEVNVGVLNEVLDGVEVRDDVGDAVLE